MCSELPIIVLSGLAAKQLVLPLSNSVFAQTVNSGVASYICVRKDLYLTTSYVVSRHCKP